MFRATLWAAIGLCATLILAVLLSNPHIVDRVQRAADSLSDRLHQMRPTEAGTEAGTDTGTSAGAGLDGNADIRRPAVRTMPSNRIPVRRAGVARAD